MACDFCKESTMGIGTRTDYGSIIIYKIGASDKDGWFATLSPKTGGDPEKDFTIQLMSSAHLTQFSEIAGSDELAKNYGIAFSNITFAMTKLMESENPDFKPISESKESAVSLATYGKSTNWKEKTEHLHIKIFPFRGAVGQPYTVDSSFGKKEIFTQDSGEYVKMIPVKKVNINYERVEKLSKDLIDYLK